MALSSTYVQAPTKIARLLETIRDGQAPDQFSQQLLKDLGFTSSSDRAFLPMLKAIGFLSPDGKPTSAYHEFRDHSKSSRVLGRQLREAYSDIFLIKQFPTQEDRAAIEGKFKSYHNASDNVAGLMAKTFLALLEEADISASDNSGAETPCESEPIEVTGINESASAAQPLPKIGTGLHYNIQIHLPPTKDIEVYNAIFKSLREHLINE